MPDCTKAIQPRFKMTLAYTNRGMHWHIQKTPDLVRALADFNKAIELSPEYVTAIAGRAEVFRLQGKFDQAVTDFNKALKLRRMIALRCSISAMPWLARAMLRRQSPP